MKRNEIIEKLIERDGGRCSYCGKALTADTLSVEHIIPRWAGGTEDTDNLVLCCRECNFKAAGAVNAFAAEIYLSGILRASDNFRNVKDGFKGNDAGIDITAERREGAGWRKIAVEVKTGDILTMARIRSVLEQVLAVKAEHAGYKFILAVFARLSEAAVSLLEQNGIEVWDLTYISVKFAKEIETAPNQAFKRLFEKPATVLKTKAEKYIEKLKSCEAGKQNWSAYQKLVGEILSYLFCPPLSYPVPERADRYKVNRRDFIFPNYCEYGYWAFLRENYRADYIVADAKNYVNKIKKADVLQVANYLKAHGTGLFGIIVSRNGYGDSAYNILSEAWATDGKMIVSLDDGDMEQMLLVKASGGKPEIIIRQKIEDFRLSF